MNQIPDFEQEIVPPAYEDGCFSHLPSLIGELLGVDGRATFTAQRLGAEQTAYQKVIVLLADAFGWQYIERFSDHPALRRIINEGAVHRLTSQFPSTTSAHVTTMSTGEVVGKHGIYEWQYYEPQLDAMIIPLMYTLAGEQEPELLRSHEVTPDQLLPRRTIYGQWHGQGIDSRIYLPSPLHLSTYSQMMSRGATITPYNSFSNALASLKQHLGVQTNTTCHYLYFGDIDSTAHTFGPESKQVEAEIITFLNTLERDLFHAAGKTSLDTLFLLTADHGQIGVDPSTTIFLNLLSEFSTLEPWLVTDQRGRLLTPGGSARDMFLYIRPEALDDAHAFLSQLLSQRADVVRTSDLIAGGYFGTTDPSDAFNAHISNLVILPQAGESVWWYERGRFDQKFYGHHGGLSPQEMEIPLLAIDL